MKQKAICKQKKKLQEAQEKEQEKYWDPTRPTKRKKETSKEEVETVDVFRRVFENITKIIRGLWLERNMDHHRPLQGQKRITKITEATQTVTHVYSL